MNVGIVGSRDYPSLTHVVNFVRALARKYPDAVVLSGGARGVDKAAEEVATECGLLVSSWRPVQVEGTWVSHYWVNTQVVDGEERVTEMRETGVFVGPTQPTFARAAFQRNGFIVKGADRIVAFWDGESTGTADTLSRAKGAGVERLAYGPDGISIPEPELDRLVHAVLDRRGK